MTFHSVAANAQYAVAHWDATYTFSATGRKVLNRIDATFELDAHGLFVRHADDFSFHAWAVQALGGIGRALGWTAALNNKVSTGATKRLDEFIAKGAVASAPSSSASASAASVAAPAPSAAPAYLAPQHVVVYTERYDVDAGK